VVALLLAGCGAAEERRPNVLLVRGGKVPSEAYWGRIRTSERKLVWRERRQDDAPTSEVALIELSDVAADPLE
jgi:hypothetical protein